MRFVLPTTIFLLFLTLSFSQLTNAQVATSPLTSPVTGPVTGPITSPSLSAIISGKVLYRFIRFWPGPQQSPAKNVTVQAVDKKTDKVYSTQTDTNGMYSLTVTPGKYRVRVINGEDVNLWSPRTRSVHVKANEIEKNENFKGYIFQFR